MEGPRVYLFIMMAKRNSADNDRRNERRWAAMHVPLLHSILSAGLTQIREGHANLISHMLQEQSSVFRSQLEKLLASSLFVAF